MPQVCIAGGGPAGIVLGYLLARVGVQTLVLEKHKDFLRDFRGDTIHPSTLEIMHELGLLEEFLRLPHQKAERLAGRWDDHEVPISDFSSLPSRCRYIALMPQWDFLNFMAEKAKRFPCFELKMEAEITSLRKEGDRVVGVLAKTPEGPLEVQADLVIGADGRHSIVREKAGLEVKALSAPIDVLWMHIARKPTDPAQTFGYFKAGKILVLLNRDTYWQGGFVIAKGGIEDLKAKGLDFLKAQMASIAPFITEAVQALRSWDEVKLLSVRVDRLEQWYKPGVLCIGDAAHAMSPIGGVGINLAIQDAVATANRLAKPLREGRVTLEDLASIQKRRTWPTVLTQWMQIFVQNNVLTRALFSQGKLPMPLGFRMLRQWPWLRRIPARLVGLGVRPEHVSQI